MASACDGRRVFVLGGELSPDVQVDEAKLIHVLDTSMYFLFVILFRQPSSLKQSSSFIRNPTPTLPSIVRRQHMLERRTVLFLSNELPLKTRAPPPHRRLLVSETQVCHRDRDPRVRVVGQGLSLGKTIMSKVQRSLMQSSLPHDGSSGKETARSEDGRLIKLERQLSETLVAKA
jgi:hypothetical protein